MTSLIGSAVDKWYPCPQSPNWEVPELAELGSGVDEQVDDVTAEVGLGSILKASKMRYDDMLRHVCGTKTLVEPGFTVM